jgi:hypothetical protein
VSDRFTVSSRDVTKMTLDELQAEAASLAETRTSVRERQVEVQGQIDIETAVNQLPDAARRIVRLRLEGGAEPAGITNGGAK